MLAENGAARQLARAKNASELSGDRIAEARRREISYVAGRGGEGPALDSGGGEHDEWFRSAAKVTRCGKEGLWC